MRRILSVALALLILSLQSCWELSPAFAADVQLGTGGVYRTLASNKAWSAANNVWVVSPINQNESACLYFTNFNPSNSHSFTLAVQQTADPYVADYSNNTAEWVPAVVNGSASPLGASSSVQVSASLSGAAQFAVIVSGAASAAGSPDTFNLLITQGAPCSAPTTWSIISAPPSGTQAKVVRAAVAGVRHIATSVSGSLVTTVAPGAGCSTGIQVLDGSTLVYQVGMAIQNVASSQSLLPPGPINIVGTAGQSMTVQMSGGCTNVFETVDLNGVDSQ